MMIAVDGTTLRARNGGPGAGIEQYTRMLADALVERASTASGFDVRVTVPMGSVPFVSRHVTVPLQAWAARADLLLCPSGQIPYGWFGRSAIIVHDLAAYEHPEWFPEGAAGGFADNAARSIRRANAIIAVSEATRAQVARLFPEAADKLTVVYPGVQQKEIPPLHHSLPAGRARLNDLILSVGTIEPRKNLVNAIAAFDAFLRMHPERATTSRFALAGQVGWKAEAVLEAVAQMNDAWRKKAGEDVVRMMGYVSEGEKEALYAQAACLFFPSWYEGFGLPALEAMAAGCPVIASNRGALPEVCGDAAMYVEPDDVEQMALALAQCVMLPEAMGEMVAGAKVRASQFTWERTARMILETIG